MDKKTSKIITTVLLSIFLIAVAGLALRFFGALWNMDDDLMFIYGFTLMTITSVTFLFIFLSESIASIWKKKKIKKGESYGKEEKRN